MITKAPWIIKGQDIIGNEPNGYICTWSGKIANAQAIAALPDLIEALHDLVHLFPQFCRDADEWIQYRNAQSALKRAGIEVGR